MSDDAYLSLPLPSQYDFLFQTPASESNVLRSLKEWSQ